jgi:adenosylcobinamide kinase / adenosylcobinamide-phosphate guanylyltransferase
MEGKVIFVCGGVRSGKSAFAEEIAVALSKKKSCSLHYIACGKAVDVEMKQRIDRHQQDRRDSNAGWKTWERPSQIGEIADQFTVRDIVLVDCITTLVTNELFGEGDLPKGVTEKVVYDIKRIASNAGAVILVSNDVFCEPLSRNEIVKHFVHTLGAIHQQVTAIADTAYSVNKGIAVMKKERGQTRG